MDIKNSKHKKLAIVLAILVAIWLFSQAPSFGSAGSTTTTTNTANTASSKTSNYGIVDDFYTYYKTADENDQYDHKDASEAKSSATTSKSGSGGYKQDAYYGNGAYTPTTWDVSRYPDYVHVDGNAVRKYDLSIDSVPVYGKLDSLGRATYAADIITAEDRKTAKQRGRQSISSISLNGWNQGKCEIEFPDTGKTYRGDFYNRSHLLADSLGGDPTKDNLVVGTRTQNVGKNDGKGGMAYTEELARNYLDRGGKWVYYAATPVYEGNEIVPRSVFVDILSDDGSIDMHVEVFNTAYGYTIDYATGQWYAS